MMEAADDGIDFVRFVAGSDPCDACAALDGTKMSESAASDYLETCSDEYCTSTTEEIPGAADRFRTS